MPAKKTVATGTSKNPPAPAAKRQRTMTNKQQQLGKRSSESEGTTNRWLGSIIVAQRNEKEDSAKQRALTDAVRSEQRQEEIMGFHKRKLPGNVLFPVFLAI